jgi:chromate transporter
VEVPPDDAAGAGSVDAAPASPASLTDLFVSFSWLALQGFGGVMAVVQRELVERKRWLTRDAFIEDWAVAQTLPGPNVINLALMIGDRCFGLRGALVALAGILLLPLGVVLCIAAGFATVAEHAAVQGALRGMGAMAAALLAATGLKLASALRGHPLGLPVCAALGGTAFAAVAVLRLPLPWVLLGLGSLACGWTYRRLGKMGADAAGRPDRGGSGP